MGETDPRRETGLTAAEIAGAIAWWQDAGVDCDFVDGPTRWLAAAAAPGASPPAAGAAPHPAGLAPVATEPAKAALPLGGDPAGFPATLAEFREWWLTEPSLDDGQVRDRVAPRGEARPRLMVIVGQPGPDDRLELLAGREGRLLEGMLAAMGLDPGQVYLASALVRHTPLPDWAGLAERGLGRIVAHHIGLVAPQAVVAFGSNIPSLLGHDPAQNAQTLPVFNHEGSSVPLLAARELGALLARPAWKAGFWRRWLDWTGTFTA